MKKLKVSELFFAIQGEGRHAGTPSIFLRTFGCNFRCKSFGHTHGTVFEKHNPEVQQIINNLDKYNGLKFNQLPLVNTGCDTYAAVYPEFKEFSPFLTTAEIAQQIKSILGNKKFNNDLHLVLTGGEPLLPGWQKAYVELVGELYTHQIGNTSAAINITFETNGTQDINSNEFDKLVNLCGGVHFSVSPKMVASGEGRIDAIKPQVIQQYLEYGIVDLKFVVDSADGVEEVRNVLDNEYKTIKKHPFFGSIYLMPEGGTNEAYQKNQKSIAQLAIDNGFRFSPRLQCLISDNQWGT